MKGLTISSATVALVAILAGACSSDIPSAATPADPSLARGGPGGPPAPAAYTTLDVGALLPGTSSEARGVNDAGVVVGFYRSGSADYPFALVSGSPVTLGGGSGWAYGVSNGSPAFVAGNANGMPARWNLANPSQPTLLPRTAAEVADTAFGYAGGVNGVGDAVGIVGPNPAMWLADGTRIPIATPAGFVRGEGRGIDDAGLAVFQFFTQAYETGASRGYLRLASGALIVMPPVGGDFATFANDIGEVANGLVYVAGSTRSSSQVSRAVRWTVDVASGAIVATNVLATTDGYGLGVSDAGGIAGFTVGRSLLGEAYLWRGTNVLKLALPKGTRDARAWALSRSGQYVAGWARLGGGALRWTITTP